MHQPQKQRPKPPKHQHKNILFPRSNTPGEPHSLEDDTGKTKRLDDIIKLQKEVKECREIIKSLERQLKKREKEPDSDTSKREQKKLEKIALKELDNRDKCPTCKSGDLITADLGVRLITSCSKKCGYRLIVKFDGKKEESEEV